MVYTDHQRLELEKEFHYSRYITIRRKSELAANLGLTERQVCGYPHLNHGSSTGSLASRLSGRLWTQSRENREVESLAIVTRHSRNPNPTIPDPQRGG